MSFAEEVDGVAEIVKKKNVAYGNSFGTSGSAWEILYPDGIKPKQYENALLLARIWDKMKRLATDNDSFGESPFIDIAGYALCGLTLRPEREATEEETKPDTGKKAGTCICTPLNSPNRDCLIHGE
jgi:hypothetical protein